MDAPTTDLIQRGFGYALSLVHDRARAEDLLQDAWASVLAAGGPRTRAYLFRAIRSRWVDGERRGRVVRFEPLDDAAAVIDARPDPRADDPDAMARAFATLRPEEREAIYLCVVEGYSASEAAALIGAPKNTVQSLVRRGRERLRAWFTATDEEALP